jgi:ribonuclease J
VVISLVAVDESTGEIIYGPDFISRGFVFEDQEGFILEEAKAIVLEVLKEIESPGRTDWAEVCRI